MQLFSNEIPHPFYSKKTIATQMKKQINSVPSHSSRSFTQSSKDNVKITELLDSIYKRTMNNSNTVNEEFKSKIDELNLEFYLQTEKYLSDHTKDQKCQSALFVILFKQISVYIDEIERLNKLIKASQYDSSSIKENINRYKEAKVKDEMIKLLKESNAKMEKRLSECLSRENELKIQNEELKKTNLTYRKALSDMDQRMSDITKAGSNLSNEEVEVRPEKVKLIKIVKDKLSKNNKECDKFLNELNKSKKSSKSHVKTEIIISDLEDYYKKNMKASISITKRSPPKHVKKYITMQSYSKK